MLHTPKLGINALIRSRVPGYTLPADFYLRPDIFDVDVEIFFRRSWIYIGLEADVPEPGDVSTVDVGPSGSVIIVRGDDGAVRAFHNVCRHRGARLLDGGKANVGKLVCPYHQWTYELTGELLHAAHMGKQFDTSGHGLLPVNLRSVGGLLFVCLADEPPKDFDALASVMEPRLAAFDLRKARIAYEKDIVEEGNWKLTMENNRECYHCPGSHPELAASFLVEDFGFNPEELSEEEAVEAEKRAARCEGKLAQWEAMGYSSRAVDHLIGVATNFRTERLVIRGAGESQTLDTKVACKKLLGTLAHKELGDLHFWTHNSWHHFMSDHAVTIYQLPLAPDRTLVRTKWLVHKDAVEGVDYDLEHLTQVWIATNDQDSQLVARAHRGIRNPAYRPGPYSRYTEGYVDQFVSWYIERLQAHGF